MTRDIRPLTPDDIPELSRFLTAGFAAPPDADFAAPEVLRWKYLQKRRLLRSPKATTRVHANGAKAKPHSLRSR